MASDGRASARRAQALHDYAILDTESEPQFDAIVKTLAARTGAPLAYITLIDDRRQWHKAQLDSSGRETPLAMSICLHALGSEGVFEVPDTIGDARFRDHPAVTGGRQLRYYAAAPLRTEGGIAIGTLCVADTVPRTPMTDKVREELAALGRRTMAALELRRELQPPTD